MRAFLPVLFALSAPLAACSGVSYAMQEYGEVDVERFSYGDDTWRIFHRPDERKLMITPSLGRSAASGAASGLTLGLGGGPTGPFGAYRAAAQSYVAMVGAGCAITDGGLVMTSQYEFYYSCP